MEQKTFYMKFKSGNRMEMHLRLWSQKAFQAYDHDSQYIMGIYFGILFFMFFFNLLFFFQIKDRAYLSYVIFVASYAIFQLMQNGFIHEYFWPENIKGYDFIVILSLAIVLVSTVYFTRTFLNTKIKTKKIEKAMQALTASAVFPLLIPFIFSYSIAIQVQILTGLIIIISVLAIGIYFLIKNYRPARFFMIAWSALLVGAIIYILKAFGFLQSNFITNYSMQIGSVIQFLLLSFGLGDRINLIKLQKEEALSMAIENLKMADRQKSEFVAETKKITDEIEDLNLDLQEKIQELDIANRRIGLSEEKYRLLVEGSNEIIFSLDEHWNFLTINEAVKYHFKISPSEVINTNLLDLIYEGQDERSVTKQIVHEKLELFSRERNPVTFKAAFRSPIVAEPKEMLVRLEYINLEGKNEILGKASSIEEDALIQYFNSEKQKFIIGNFLITAEDISHRITRNLQKYLSQREIKFLRVAIREMIINAIEHGNLNITFEEKTRAMDNDNYFEFVAERQRDPEYNNRKIVIEYEVDQEKVMYTITDEGEGFKWEDVLNEDRKEKNELMLSHGRGISITEKTFDEIKYNQKGNQVTLVKYFKPSGAMLEKAEAPDE